ncbi:S1 family peptidase [Algibacter lectus]|uniref:HtrA protease n=1 Tax=Algibacter lectus TaxID=221126 RepID=A0A090VK36_9FLAO|nr:serine protease [Algibacter lectus]GAL65081.1 HtrA protease [Algibacter lectus]
MKINYIIFLSLSLTLCCCNPSKTITNEKDTRVVISGDEVENGSAFIDAANKEVEKIVLANKHTTYKKLQKDKVKNFEANSGVEITHTKLDKKTGNQMYYYLQDRTVFIGTSYLCDKCPNVHLSSASGFVIHEDGIVVTNYHVINPESGDDNGGVFAVTQDGTVYVVTEILSASKSNDLAIIKIETNGEKLKALPLAETELIGEDVYVMGHPFKNTFFMTKGIISRKYISSKNAEPKISITAEFGIGSSGGPVVNDSGEVVGVVSATHPYYTGGGKKGDLQLVTKIVIPVSQLNKYIKD